MTPAAVALVLASAFLHAYWNLHAKRAGGGAGFVWLTFCGSALCYVPFAAAVWLLYPPHLGAVDWVFIGGTSLWHVIYFLLLQRGYRNGDFSVVYPLARGTGPLLSAAAATLLFGERPGAVGWLGIILVLGGIFAFAGDPRRVLGAHRRGVGYALGTGAMIAVYTLWDKHAVGVLLISPIIYDCLGNFGRALVLAPLAWRRRDEVVEEWRSHRAAVAVVAVLSPLAYLMVLFALRIAPVSYVAPARELSIVIGTFLGLRVLSEGQARRRIAAATVVVAGIVAIAFA
ncbi:MAG: EamA family transporter [bacterium]|nr:EamA family transporter [bacterium]